MAYRFEATLRKQILCCIWFWSVCLLLGWSLSSASQAIELYRCTHNGEVEFRQTACQKGEQAITEVVEQSRGMTPVEPALKLIEVPTQKSVKKTSNKQTHASEERCWKTEKRLERVQRRLRAGYKPSQYDGLHRKQAEYEEYLRRFCAG